jgi:hypothetical protein
MDTALVSQQRYGFQESTPFIFVFMDTHVAPTLRRFVFKYRISPEMCLPIRFLGTAYMSQYVSLGAEIAQPV